MANHIDEKTKISLFAAIAGLSTVFIAALWLAALSAKTDQAIAKTFENERKVEKQTELLFEIRDRVIRIEEKINTQETK